MKIKLEEIARAADVSVSTVSRALSGDTKKPSSRETTERIIKIANDMGYFCEHPTPVPARTLECVLASPFDTLSDYFYVQMLGGINEEASRLGYKVVRSFSASADSTKSIADALHETDPDGIIFLGRFERDMMELAREQCGRAVYSGLNRLDEEIDQVICDAYGAIRALTEHLISLGHAKIGYIGAMPDVRADIVNERRFSAFSDALKLSGLQVDTSYCVDIDPGMQAGYDAAIKLIDHGTLPDALCCANDTVAMGAISALHDRGLGVPDDVSVVGMNMDDSDIARYMHPKLTTAYMQMSELGKFAVKLLDDRVKGLHTIPALVMLPYKLVLRESSSPTAKKQNH